MRPPQQDKPPPAREILRVAEAGESWGVPADWSRVLGLDVETVDLGVTTARRSGGRCSPGRARVHRDLGARRRDQEQAYKAIEAREL